MKTALVITTISEPTKGIRHHAIMANASDDDFYVIGDKKTPYFSLTGCKYYSLLDQLKTEFYTAWKSPFNSYTRKNIGYLLAQANHADIIVETDDDNIPYANFWKESTQHLKTALVYLPGWVNVYKHFTQKPIWPRGLPLDEINNNLHEYLRYECVDCPIQQSLADKDPDVDAIYRLVHADAVYFEKKTPLALDNFVWSPFNSQNTTWFSEAFPLMYLPSTCSFRMTDIWRGLVAQRILWTNNQKVLFCSPTVVQERNKHDLIDDFQQEVPGYLNNKKIAEALEKRPLQCGFDKIPDNMRVCYETFVSMGLLEKRELKLLDYWLEDYAELQ